MPRRGVASLPAASAALPGKRGRSSLSQLVLRSVAACTARKGASLVYIKKALAAEGYDVARNGGRLKAAVGALLSKGLLRRVTGSGVAGSFRIGKERAEGSGRAGGGRRQRPGGEKTKKGPKRGVKAAAQRLKKPRRARGKEAEGGALEAGGAAEEEAAAGES